MNDPTKRLTLLSRGKAARMVLGELQPFLDIQREKLISKLKQDFRFGKSDAMTLSSGVASLCTLDDLQKELEKAVEKSDQLNTEQMK